MNDKPTKYEDLKINCPHCKKQINFFYPIPALSQYHPDMYISQEMEYQERRQLQSNWNSLRELLENEKKLIEEDEFFSNLSNKDYIEFILDKMNELERNESNGK